MVQGGRCVAQEVTAGSMWATFSTTKNIDSIDNCLNDLQTDNGIYCLNLKLFQKMKYVNFYSQR